MGRSAEQGRLKDVGRSTWLSGWVSTSFRGATRDRQQGRRILGREGGMAIRAGAWQTKSEATFDINGERMFIWKDGQQQRATMEECNTMNRKTKTEKNSNNKRKRMITSILLKEIHQGRRHSAETTFGQREMPGGWFGFEATEEQKRSWAAKRAAVLMPSPTTAGSTPWPGTTESIIARTEETEWTTICGRNRAQQQRSIHAHDGGLFV